MKYSTILAALLSAALLCASAGAQEASRRTVIKSVTVGSPDGKQLTCKDIVSSYTRPQTKRYGWTSDSEITDKPATVRPRVPVLPSSPNPEVTYGKVPSRNEFGINRGWYLSPDGARVAVYRVDETQVGSFPLLDVAPRAGALKSIKYPMNGMDSEHVALCVCDTLGNVLNTLDVTDFTEERYLAGVSWTPDSRYLLVQVVDRPQHEMHLNLYDASDGSFVRRLLEERNDAWIEPRSGVSFIGDTGFFIYRTDNRDGFYQLYLCDLQGGIRRLTQCSADVAYVAEGDGYVYYTSAEVSPAESHLFSVQLKFGKGRNAQRLDKVKIGKPQQLTSGSGWHTVTFSPDRKRFIDVMTAVDVPSVTVVRRSDGTVEKELYRAADPMVPYLPVTVEFGTVPSADPQFENFYRLVKPADFDPTRKYPVIVYVYGGPHSQMVKDSWLGGIRYWELLMAQKGYVLYIQDNRGTDNHGSAYARAINRRCGEAESADQVEGLRQLIAEGWADESRIGVVGWSYGGFMTITLATKYPELFKVAAAGGPVIDWKWYEVMYGERYMDNPETNPEGFAATSLVDKVPLLKARLLICQGMEDHTVLPINSLSFMQSCVENNVVADYFPYPRSEHNVTGPWREQLYLKLTDHFVNWL